LADLHRPRRIEGAAETGSAFEIRTTASAKQAYETMEVRAPECLDTAQRLSVDFYYTEWQSNDAKDRGRRMRALVR
jgi:hypothetical protein